MIDMDRRRTGSCLSCGASYTTSQPLKTFCSGKCGKRYRKKFGAVVVPRPTTKIKTCPVCKTDFSGRGPAALYCSPDCRLVAQTESDRRGTRAQYESISGNWHRWYSRAVTKKRKKDGLTVDQLKRLHVQQNGRCALTGFEMTCTLVSGTRCLTNASLDRIVPGGPYSIDNIQLVCAGVNMWRGEIPLDEFVDWCRAVVNYAEEHYEQGQSCKTEV
jgi:hypothetical protein